MFASLNLFFRDLERLTTIFTTILFYVTPVFYPETMVPLRFQSIIKLNPLAPLLISWRNLLLEGTLQWGICCFLFVMELFFLLLDFLYIVNFPGVLLRYYEQIGYRISARE